MRKLFLYIIILVCTVRCSVNYSLSGASISPDVKTFSVSYIANHAANKQATLSDVFTEGLKDKFRSDAGLSLVSSGADLQFSGNITDYTTSYQGVTASQLAAQTRLTIAVKIKFVNKNDEKQNYEKRFSAYRDFDATESLSNVEDALIAEISEEIIESIFMESVANW
ncbi:MAG: LptE family protein [Bacteroidales bacterium]|nr:LptE family protein [Bacteroidales bacterium]MBQ3989344.1 LptE family protein [Bacteroidales bacterium]